MIVQEAAANAAPKPKAKTPEEKAELMAKMATIKALHEKQKPMAAKTQEDSSDGESIAPSLESYTIHINNVKQEEIFAFDVKDSTTVGDVKRMIKAIGGDEGIPTKQQRLVFGDAKDMDNPAPIADYNITNGSVLTLVLKLRGGARGAPGSYRVGSSHKDTRAYIVYYAQSVGKDMHEAECEKFEMEQAKKEYPTDKAAAKKFAKRLRAARIKMEKEERAEKEKNADEKNVSCTSDDEEEQSRHKVIGIGYIYIYIFTVSQQTKIIY